MAEADLPGGSARAFPPEHGEPPGVTHLRDDLLCPHCGSPDVDWGATGLNQCRTCDGLFRQLAQDALRRLPGSWTPGSPLDASWLRDTGLLWLINATVFHPRGFALTFVHDDAGELAGWRLDGDGTEPWQYDREVDIDSLFLVAQAFLDLHREPGGD